jgi:RHS repeat-associated protein
MTGLTDTNAVASAYGFDADQNRVTENTVRYVYDGPNVVLEIENNLPKAAYVSGLGIDQPIERIQFISGVADGRHVYHTDALGSVWAMTDDLQVVAKSYSYEAFGKLRSETGTGLLFPNRYTYTARESIGDSLGLYYYRARVMDPNAGRFTSEDPLGFVDGDNVFLYVNQSPITFLDPLGTFMLCRSSWWCGAPAGVAGGPIPLPGGNTCWLMNCIYTCTFVSQWGWGCPNRVVGVTTWGYDYWTVGWNAAPACANPLGIVKKWN